MENIDLLKIEAKSNIPLLITDEDELWKVEKGSVNIFVSKINKDEPFGLRSFLVEANCDDIFFSLGSVESNYKYGLVVVPKEDSVLTNIRFNTDEFTLSDICLDKSKYWISRTAYNCDMPKKEIDMICNNLDSYKIANYNKNLLKIFVTKIKEQEQKEKVRLKERIVTDNSKLKKGIINLGGVILPKKRKKAIENFISPTHTSDLYRACKVVAQSKNIDIVYPHYIDESINSSDKMLELIADSSHFRIRQISLKDGWHKKNGGSMVAYKKSDRSPIALIQYKPNKYKMFDPKSNTSVIVTSSIAEQIESQAYMFYRSLPMKSLSTKEIFQFVLKGVHKYDIALVFIMGIVGGLLGIITPEITGKVFDTVIPDGEAMTLVHIGFLMVSVSIATFAFDLTRYFATMRIEFISEQDLQSAVWDRVLSLPVKFFKDISTGEMMQNIMSITSIKKVISGSVINTVISSIFSLFFLIMLFRYSVKLAFISLALLIAVLLVSVAINMAQLKYQKRLVDDNNKMSGRIFDWLNGLMKIKISGSEKRVFSQWSEDFSNIRETAVKTDKLKNYSVTFNSVVNILISMVLYFTLSKMSDSGLTAGKFIAFTTALGKLISSSIEFSRTLLQMNVIGPLYKKVKPIFEAVPEYDEHKQDPGKLKGELEISHLSFSYSDDSPMVLDDISFHIKSGEYVAIVGSSGCGKSTLLRNLLGFETPNSGQLYFDGKSLDQIDVRAVRKQVGVVLQTGAILTGSIYENVTAANPSLTYDDVWHALEIAGIDAEVRAMPMGLNTVIMEGSPALSGGQVQRLLIARAIANNPCILFLDEATSALDNKTQDTVSKNLDKMGITRLVIAHRLSTIVNCDRIIVLNKGKIAEEGTFESLMKLDGIFASMAKRQMI